MATFTGDAMKAVNWKATPMKMPGAITRRKMDNSADNTYRHQLRRETLGNHGVASVAGIQAPAFIPTNCSMRLSHHPQQAI